MRFAKWRGMHLALALLTTLGLSLGLASSARADHYLPPCVLPGWVPAYDFTTGQQYQAPPIPYGHYAKNLDDYTRALGCVSCKLHALMGDGLGLFHHGDGCGHPFGGHDGCGHGHHGHGGHGPDGCGSGHGLFGHHNGLACVVPGCGGGSTCHHGEHGHDGPGTAVTTTSQSLPSAQARVEPSGQFSCGYPGCHIKVHHWHTGHHGSTHDGFCGDPGCGLFHKHGHGTGSGCRFCGGAGCRFCRPGLGTGLSAAVHGTIASLCGLLNAPKVTYFVGAGGPVPLTPGYVPYIVATRSPRDYFAFPPMNPNDP